MAQLPGYQLHFVQQQRKTQGDVLKVKELERYFMALHGGMSGQERSRETPGGGRIASARARSLYLCMLLTPRPSRMPSSTIALASG